MPKSWARFTGGGVLLCIQLITVLLQSAADSQDNRCSSDASSECAVVEWLSQPVTARCSDMIDRMSAAQLGDHGELGDLQRATVVEGMASRILQREGDWSRAALIRRLDGQRFKPRDAGLVARFGPSAMVGAVEEVEVGQYLDGMRQLQQQGQLFISSQQQQQLLAMVDGMLRHPAPKRWMFSSTVVNEHASVLSIAGDRKGLPLHVHGAAWLLQVKGAKRCVVVRGVSGCK